MLSSRLSQIQESATVKLNGVAADLKASGKKVYNFGIGEPDFTTPDTIIESAFEWARKGKTHYTPAAGVMELREAIAEKARTVNSLKVTAKNVLVTPTKFSIYLSLFTILDEGDSAILPDPYYVSYPDIIRLVGGKVLTSPLDENYSMDLESMQKLISPRTKAIILNSPSNPTGRLYSEKEIRELVDFAIKNKLYIISDEIYEDLIYEGNRFSPGSIDEIADYTITVSGFSKSYAMTGWRIGYMIASEEIVKAATKIQGQTLTCTPSISQYGALEALRDKEDPIKFREIFRKRRDKVMGLLNEIDGLETVKPSGAFYTFPKYNSKLSSVEYCNKLLNEKQVVVTPGSAFGAMGEGHFRLSFATSEQEIEEGIRRLSEFKP